MVVESNKSFPLEIFFYDINYNEKECENFSIFEEEMPLLPHTHSHQAYEFLIPLEDMPLITINGKEYCGYKNQIIPINPGEEHGIPQSLPHNSVISIMFSKNYMKSVVEEMFHSSNLEFITRSYIISRNIQTLIEMFLSEKKLSLPGKNKILLGLGNNLAVLLLRELCSSLHSPQRKYFNDYTFKLKPTIDYIHRNYKSGCTLEELAQIAEMSIYHFIRVFKSSTGKTPHEYLLDIKLEQVKSLLATKEMTIMEICFESGFNNLSHFVKLFKKRTGVTPSQYRSIVYNQNRIS